jgi:hypothetical protein
MRMVIALLLSIVLFAPHSAFSQGKFDGTWSGTAGLWQIKLVVTGQKGRAAFTCANQTHAFDIPVGPDGAIDAWVGGGTVFVRRQVKGMLPTFSIPTGGTCPGGQTTLTR